MKIMSTHLINQSFKKYHVINNALIFPANNLKINGSPVIPGIRNSIYDIKYYEFNNIKENITKKTLHHYLKKNPPKKFDGGYLYLGAMFEHFGHFMAESIMTMYASKYFNSNITGLIAIKQKHFVKDNEVFLAVCSLMGINPKNIIFIESIAEVETLIVPKIGSYPGSKIKEWYLKELANQICIENFRDNQLPKKILVKKSPVFINRIVGLTYFSKLLNQNGFFSFYPEHYSFEKQLAFIINAKKIVWEEGSACHIVDILPVMLKTRNFVIKRRPENAWTDDSIKNKFPNLTVYNDARQIKILYLEKINGKKILMMPSFLNRPKKLHQILIKKGYINTSNFNLINFKFLEIIDIFSLIKVTIMHPIKCFMVQNIKKYINTKIWAMLKKIFFFL